MGNFLELDLIKYLLTFLFQLPMIVLYQLCFIFFFLLSGNDGKSIWAYWVLHFNIHPVCVSFHWYDFFYFWKMQRFYWIRFTLSQYYWRWYPLLFFPVIYILNHEKILAIMVDWNNAYVHDGYAITNFKSRFLALIMSWSIASFKSRPKISDLFLPLD